MDTRQFWTLIEEARSSAPDADSGSIAARAGSLLAEHPVEVVLAAQQTLWDVLAQSYTNPLWAAAYLINGGCSDDGFDYFRGWLLTQGQEVYTRAVADPDSLAGLPQVQEAAEEGDELEGEDALSIVWDAYKAKTGEQLPGDCFTISYPELDPAWDFDFDDAAEMRARLPRLAALYLD